MFLYSFFIAMILSGQIIGSQQQTETQKSRHFRYIDRENNYFYSTIARKDETSFNKVFGSKKYQNQLDFRNYRNETLCHAAISHHCDKMLEKLVSKVDVDVQAYDGQTASHYAVFHNNTKALDLLYGHHANFELRDDDGMTPFALAVRLNRTAMAESLLRKGADVHAKNKYGHEPLHFVKSALMVRRLLANNVDINAQGVYGDTPISRAVKHNIHEVVQELLNNKALVDYVDEHGNSLLHLTRDGKIAQLLIDSGLSLYAENNKGDMPLHCAARLLSSSVALVLMNSGVTPDSRNKIRKTPLHNVYSVETAQALLDRGADIQALDDNKNSPLHSVVKRSKKENILYWADIENVFILLGSNVYQHNGSGHNIAYFSFVNKRSDMLLLLKDINFNFKKNIISEGNHTYLDLAAAYGFDYGVQMMLELRFVASPSCYDGKNALHCAAEHNKYDCLKMLIEHYSGLELQKMVNLPDKNGFTLLHYAVINLNIESVKLLLRHGVNPFLKNRVGYAPIDYLLNSQDSISQEIKQLLTSCQARSNNFQFVVKKQKNDTSSYHNRGPSSA